jgi:hypothetical protein
MDPKKKRMVENQENLQSLKPKQSESNFNAGLKAILSLLTGNSKSQNRKGHLFFAGEASAHLLYPSFASSFP